MDAVDLGFYRHQGHLTVNGVFSAPEMDALVALLGLADVERNGHHFIDGFAGRPRDESLAFLHAHPDLYHEADGRVRLTIAGGRIALGSLECPGFGSAVVPDLSTTAPMAKAEWPLSAP